MTLRFDTHDIFNQSPPFEDVDLFASDRALADAVAANGAGAEAAALSEFGRRWGTAAMFEAARVANENTPKLKTFDTKGFRRDEVEFHPAYHGFMYESFRDGLHASTWDAQGRRAAAPSEVARAARYYMVAQVENGHMCPITMTRAGVGALAVEPALLDRLIGKIVSRSYDPRFIPWWEKDGITLGMGMTEKQGGTDVRANTTTATPAADGYSHHRAQMVHVGADVRRVPRAGAGAGRAHLLPDAALPSRRLGQRAALPAPEGQARQPLECVLRGGVRRRLCLARRRGGARRAHHHRDGAAHPRRLRDLVGRDDAHGAGAGAASCAPPHRVPEEARRPADDAHAASPTWRSKSKARPR